MKTVLFISLGWAVTLSSSVVAQHAIDLKAKESLLKIFGDSASIAKTIVRLSAEERKQIADSIKSSFLSDSLVLYECRIGQKTMGFGIVDNIKGKTQLITYLVALTPDGVLKDVDVLVYRESIGGEIQYESFRKQFRGRTSRDKLQAGRDIKNISGATISSHAITDGVRKLLMAFNLVHSGL
ncbi:MAG: FMN-binding protein [Ignavibacteriae bacterium]|nr:FMN-binding protein [Ignavibacteria bacterium]MBI3365119.1 FMN-binding protein [Ignavibacteriota bacterium]